MNPDSTSSPPGLAAAPLPRAAPSYVAWMLTVTGGGRAPRGAPMAGRPSRRTGSVDVLPPMTTDTLERGRYDGGVVTRALPVPSRVKPFRPASISQLQSCAAERVSDTRQPHCDHCLSMDV